MPDILISIDTSQLEAYCNNVIAGLGQLEFTLDEILRSGLEEAVNLAKETVPVDTGRLQESIRLEGGAGSYLLVADAKNPYSGVGYASFVEEGTHKMEARPFISYALEQVMPDIISQAQEAVTEIFSTRNIISEVITRRGRPVTILREIGTGRFA